MTPLHVAAEEGNHEVVGYLVRKGANINIEDRKGVRISGYTTKCIINTNIAALNSSPKKERYHDIK